MHRLTTLYASLATLGLAALGSAAASSLIAGLAGSTGPTAVFSWMAVFATSAWAAAALLYAFAAFRSNSLLRSKAAIRAVALAAAIHLAALMVGIWRLPEASRTFDVTLACLVVLELSVLAVMGWQSNSDRRARQPGQTSREPSALAIVGTLFAASVLVAAVATAGMASSAAGSLAVPHSGHGQTQHNSPLPQDVQQLKNADHHH